MGVKDAVVERFNELMKQKGLLPNALANLSGVTPSTVYSMLDPRRKELSINLIKCCATDWKSRWASFSVFLCLTVWSRKSNEIMN